MSIYELKWSKQEKKIARKAFDEAYQREMEFIRQELAGKLRGLKEANDIWKLYDYLAEKRRELAEKYDYRYSMLMLVLARLINDGFLRLEDLEGLSEDKLDKIKELIKFANER